MRSVLELPAFDPEARGAAPVDAESFLLVPAGVVESGELS
jgi:hypothetical protein